MYTCVLQYKYMYMCMCMSFTTVQVSTVSAIDTPCCIVQTHLVAVEGVVCSREVAAAQSEGDPGQVKPQPPPAGQLRLAHEHVVACRTEHADLAGRKGREGRE